MTSTLIVSYSLWMATLAIQGGVFLLILKRRFYLEMPLFFYYTGFHLLRSLVLLGVRNWSTPTHYSYAYWSAEAISAIMGFAVIYEVFSTVLKPYEGLRQLGLILFRCSFLALIFVAIATAASPRADDSPGLISAILVFERSIRIIQCGLMAFLFLFASTLALSWRHYSFGIALGFGLSASIELISVAVRSQVGPIADQVYVFLKPGSYAVATLIWAGYLVSVAPKKIIPAAIPHNEVDRWNETILGLLAR